MNQIIAISLFSTVEITLPDIHDRLTIHDCEHRIFGLSPSIPSVNHGVHLFFRGQLELDRLGAHLPCLCPFCKCFT